MWPFTNRRAEESGDAIPFADSFLFNAIVVFISAFLVYNLPEVMPDYAGARSDRYVGKHQPSVSEINLGAVFDAVPAGGQEEAQPLQETPVDSSPDENVFRAAETSSGYQVQAVLIAKRNAVVASSMEGRIVRLPFKSGDLFKKGDLLVSYDCGMDKARLKEIEARARLSERQAMAYAQLSELETVSDIEKASAIESHAQNLALIEQVREKLRLCQIYAPFDGRVTNKMANQYEFVQTGRVLMDISSREPLQVAFLIPSVWLRWLNVGTTLDVYIEESQKNYDARVIRINGEVDPVSQSVQVVAEVSKYHEELLPGMSGRAIFRPVETEGVTDFGFIGLVLKDKDAKADRKDRH